MVLRCRAPWIPAFFLVLYNGKIDEERGRRTNGRGGVSGLVVGLLVVIIILLVLLLLQPGFFSRFFAPSQPQAPQNQPKQDAPQNQPNQQQQQAPQVQQSKQQ
jgi:cytochrome c-type biogenesis protein CcmH/NrfG